MSDSAPDPRPGESSASRPPSSSLDGGRFAPGTVLAARYRITGLLGRGGMGEVYRAEDLTLGEHVALKFLPPGFARDPDALARLHHEVRTSRQITHRNVVRVHDVGEVDGDPFLSMEFVQGEDLASLLRRIGRLPEEKGVALARQICAGLAAAHDRGVLHRDLKPANVMVDGDGNAKLTDFGLAALIADAAVGERVGTPAYMAPEQFARGVATEASDIFSLGLLLHEIFTGERAIQASTVSELTAAHRTPFSGPAERVGGLDPAIDRAVRRCLALSPGDRPTSALRVAGALPGGDPLAQALAAGETPSPELVARAEGPPALSLPVVGGLLGLALLAFGFMVWSFGQTSIFQVEGTPLEPAVLEHRARELAQRAGAFPLAAGMGRFEVDLARANDGGLKRARFAATDAPWPGLVQFAYRAGEHPIAPVTRWIGAGTTWDDPPVNTPGTVAVRLDSRGRLVELVVAHRDPPGAGPEPDDGYAPWFEAAGLDRSAFRPVAATGLPPVFADERAAWTSGEENDARALRVEAARLAGRLVWWRAAPESAPIAAPRDFLAPLLVFSAMLLIGGWFAQRNVRAGRADVRGASVLAALTGGTFLLGSLLPAPSMFVHGGPTLVFRIVAFALLFAAVSWVAYAALEPALRRSLPSTLRSWNRLLRGGFGDPFVHRDLFLGLAAGLLELGFDAALWGDLDDVHAVFPHGAAALHGLGAVTASVFHLMVVLVPMALFFLFGLPRLVVRSSILADLLGATLLLLSVSGFARFDPRAWLTAAVVIVLARFVGLVALFGFAIVPVLLQLTPFTWDLSQWWAGPSLVGPALVLGLLVTTAVRARRRVVATEETATA